MDIIQTDKLQTVKVLQSNKNGPIQFFRMQFFRRYFVHLRFVLELFRACIGCNRTFLQFQELIEKSTANHSFDCNQLWMDYANNVFGYMASFVDKHPTSTKQERDTEENKKIEEFYNSYYTDNSEEAYLVVQCIISKTTENSTSYDCNRMASLSNRVYRDILLNEIGFHKKDEGAMMNNFFQSGIIESNGTILLSDVTTCMEKFEAKVCKYACTVKSSSFGQAVLSQ